MTEVTAQLLAATIALRSNKSFTMKNNMGGTDRIVRILLAVVISVLYFTQTIGGTLGIVLLVLGGIFVLTSFISFCPLYAPFGISTCKTKESKA